MELFVQGKINLSVFDPAVRQGTQDLSEVVVAAMNTHSPAIESTHFLMALARIDNGLTVRMLERKGLTLSAWRNGLQTCTQADRDKLTPMGLTEDALDPTGKNTLTTAWERRLSLKQETIGEGNLLLSALRNATPRVQTLFQSAGLSLPDWCQEIEKWLRPPVPLELFEADGPQTLKWEALSPVAQRVLLVMKNDAQSLGYEMIDSRHLLLALVEQEGGATCFGLHQQRIPPRRIQESLTLSLRMKARSHHSEVKLDAAHLQAVLRRILRTAGEMAARDGLDRVHEPHLLRAVLEAETVARRILLEENVDITRLARVAEQTELTAEQPVEQRDEQVVADIDTIETHLKTRLVGQDDAIQRILPYIQRLRFGFTMPERPAGVFLFCGPSGSGKTQMAKELARALFGSEDAMIFLEMGQFNSRESMNIFVGAPPGYVGYGEGKLTNGLRDKPRSVVLLDEVEKAHHLVLDALLRFLDEGRIDDPAGPVRDGSRCVVVLTSNVGAEELGRLWEEAEKDPGKRAALRQQLREVFQKNDFRVEFLNRVDELICFRTLGEKDYTEIARRSIGQHLIRLREERYIDVRLDGVCEAIGRYCARIREGARAAHRLGLSVVVTPVIDFVLREKCKPPVTLHVTATSTGTDGEPVGTVKKT